MQKYISKPRGRFYSIFVDFKVAFDSINREKLWYVLHKNGCNGKMLNILKSMYQTVMMCVRVKQSDMTICTDYNESSATKFCITDCFKTLSGVKQGCILSPLLFSLYISELKKYFDNSTVRHVSLLTNDVDTSMLMYADDLTIFSDTVFDMQRKIDILFNFCVKWGLEVNLNKTKIMVFRNGGYLKSIEKWTFGGMHLDAVTYYAYLGMILSSRLCFSKCLENYSCKSLKMVGAIRKVFNTYKRIPSNIAFKIFDLKIKPLLLYGSQIWGCGYYEIIEKVQIQFCKSYLGLGKTTPNDLVLVECGRHSLSVDYNLSVIKYWTKLLHMSHERYPLKCYQQLKSHADMGRINWAYHVMKLLFTLGFGDVWNAQEQLSDVKLFLSDVKKRLVDIDMQNLHCRIKDKSNIYLNYDNVDFYPSTIVKPYISLMHYYSSRRVFALLRTHSLPIKNNLLRWNIVNNNLCEMCEGIFVENEFHILFRCSKYIVKRNTYIPECFRTRPTIITLQKLLQTNDNMIIRNVVIFLNEILKERIHYRQ